VHEGKKYAPFFNIERRLTEMTPALPLRLGAVARITGYTDRWGHWIIVCRRRRSRVYRVAPERYRAVVEALAQHRGVMQESRRWDAFAFRVLLSETTGLWACVRWRQAL
jgi:hypothetical protein